jgi:hypothetical protein
LEGKVKLWVEMPRSKKEKGETFTAKINPFSSEISNLFFFLGFLLLFV